MNKTRKDSFNDIYSSYYKKSFFFAKSYVHDDWVAENIASESFIKLWEKLKTEEIDYIEPLLLTILKNKALDYLKHEEIKRTAFEEITDWHQQELSQRISVLEECNPSEIFSKEVEVLIHKALKQLPELSRQVFLLSRFENQSNKEIAAQLSLSIKGVEYHITKALKVLRVVLKEYLPLFYLFYFNIPFSK